MSAQYCSEQVISRTKLGNCKALASWTIYSSIGTALETLLISLFWYWPLPNLIDRPQSVSQALSIIREVKQTLAQEPLMEKVSADRYMQRYNGPNKVLIFQQDALLISITGNIYMCTAVSLYLYYCWLSSFGLCRGKSTNENIIIIAVNGKHSNDKVLYLDENLDLFCFLITVQASWRQCSKDLLQIMMVLPL